MLAKKGFYYISMDCKGHGKRKSENDRKKFPASFPPDTGMATYVHMHEVIEVYSHEKVPPMTQIRATSDKK